jgi:hypothetical protein
MTTFPVNKLLPHRFMVECPDGKDRSGGAYFTTYSDARFFADHGHPCVSADQHKIYHVDLVDLATALRIAEAAYAKRQSFKRLDD